MGGFTINDRFSGTISWVFLPNLKFAFFRALLLCISPKTTTFARHLTQRAVYMGTALGNFVTMWVRINGHLFCCHSCGAFATSYFLPRSKHFVLSKPFLITAISTLLDSLYSVSFIIASSSALTSFRSDTPKCSTQADTGYQFILRLPTS